MEQPKQYLVDEQMESDLRYTEHIEELRKRNWRTCQLWKTGVTDPVSSLKLLPFFIRFGSVAVAGEGLAGVNTKREEQRRGYVGKLLRRSLRGVSERVNTAFLFGIEGLYGKYGFVSCLPSTTVTIWVQRLIAQEYETDWQAEYYDRQDIPEIIALYNDSQSCRPGTLARDTSDWERLTLHATWNPAPECLAVKHRGRIEGYAFIKGSNYGWMPKKLEVLEAAANSTEAARVLLISLGKQCWENHSENLILHEPIDGKCALMGRFLGCEIKQRFSPDGGGMGRIFNRKELLEDLSDELGRRAAFTKVDIEVSALSRLAEGSILPDDGHLIRLLLGFWSWDQAEMAGAKVPAAYIETMRSWFPGGATPALQATFTHPLDSY